MSELCFSRAGKSLILAAVLAMSPPAVQAETSGLGLNDYRIASWAGGDGMSLGQIWSLVQDRDGYLWLASSGGLVRFDGLRFATANLVESADLPAVPSRALLLARDESLWVGYSGGRGVYRIARGRVTGVFLQEKTSGFVNDILEDQAGTIWIAHDQGVYRLVGGRPSSVSLPSIGQDRQVLDLHEDRNGTLWIATGSGLYRQTGDGGFERDPRNQGSVRAISEDATGRLWVTDPTFGFRRADASPHHRETGTGMSLFHDRQGNLWVATFGQGLWKVSTSGATETIQRGTMARGLLSDELSGFLEDRDGNIWAGANQGLHRLQPNKVTSLGDFGLVTGIAFDNAGAAWVGSSDGLTRVSYVQGQSERRHRVTSAAVRTLHRADDGVIWVATAEGLHRVLNTRIVRVVPHGVGPLTSITSIASGPSGELWVCDEKLGFVRVTGSRAEREPDVTFGTSARPTLVVRDRLNRLWVAFDDGTLSAVNRNGAVERFGAKDGLPYRTITALHVDANNSVWIGGDTGLSRLIGKRFQTLAFPDGLEGRTVVEIMDGESGEMWVGLRALGLLRLTRENVSRAVDDQSYRLRYTLYNTSTGTAGLPSTVSTSNTARDKSGRLWFVTRRGLTVVDPRALHSDVGVVLGSLRVEGVDIDDRWSPRLAGMVVPPRTNRLRIDYSIVNLSSFDQSQFRYRLDGFDTSWIDGTGRRQAQYTNLPPGQYTFRLQVTDAAGVWEEPGIIAAFSIAPAFYQTRAFFVASVLAVVLLIAGGWRLRMRQVRRELSAVLKERVRLSREIHDTLLQSLVGVALQLEAASRGALTAPARDMLVQMRRQIEEYIRDARQSIWNLRSPSIERRDIVTSLRDVAQQLTEGRLELDFAVSGTPRPCSSKVATQVLRIAQEAVTNTVRHAAAQHVEMHVSFADHVLRVQVSDDGQGFDPQLVAHVNGHYGLIGMKERASEVGGRCSIDTLPGGGVRVVTEVPLLVS